MEVTFSDLSGYGLRAIAEFRTEGRLVAVLIGLRYLYGSVVAHLSITTESPHHHFLCADGTCTLPYCLEDHAPWIDLALEAGWECPALEAAVAQRLRSET